MKFDIKDYRTIMECLEAEVEAWEQIDDEAPEARKEHIQNLKEAIQAVNTVGTY